ncbi:MAG: hypothetical protein MJ252_07360, partial [archaeon]|nr:hypothetical protein [archaeon]
MLLPSQIRPISLIPNRGNQIHKEKKGQNNTNKSINQSKASITNSTSSNTLSDTKPIILSYSNKSKLKSETYNPNPGITPQIIITPSANGNVTSTNPLNFIKALKVYDTKTNNIIYKRKIVEKVNLCSFKKVEKKPEPPQTISKFRSSLFMNESNPLKKKIIEDDEIINEINIPNKRSTSKKEEDKKNNISISSIDEFEDNCEIHAPYQIDFTRKKEEDSKRNNTPLKMNDLVDNDVTPKYSHKSMNNNIEEDVYDKIMRNNHNINKEAKLKNPFRVAEKGFSASVNEYSKKHRLSQGAQSSKKGLNSRHNFEKIINNNIWASSLNRKFENRRINTEDNDKTLTLKSNNTNSSLIEDETIIALDTPIVKNIELKYFKESYINMEKINGYKNENIKQNDFYLNQNKEPLIQIKSYKLNSLKRNYIKVFT